MTKSLGSYDTTESLGDHTLKRQKRKLYRERYAWLDQYEQDLHNVINQHTNGAEMPPIQLAKAS
ncbi:hypothetical protein A165_10520 [Vibrio tasmaniensis ZS-17]|nr:DUF535 family protein [Vibrio tasmaniensis]OED64212.1 hypothetical protein A165_10520 [Vibrio tasmaniensis ZS-17]